MAKKLIAIVMALALVLSFAACGGKGDDTTTAPETTTDPFDAFGEETTAAPAEDPSATDASATTADDTTAAPADATTAAAGDTTTAAAAKAPQTKEEIVAYFNTAINGVKKGAKSVTHHYSKISLNGATKLPSWANSVLKLLGGADKFINDQLTKNSKGEETLTGSAAIKASFPVEGESWSSKLTAADVQSAVLKESNGKYMIRITTVADADPPQLSTATVMRPRLSMSFCPALLTTTFPALLQALSAAPQR